MQVCGFLRHQEYCILVCVAGGDQGRLLDEADVVVSALETPLLQAEGAQTLLRKRHQGKERSRDTHVCNPGVLVFGRCPVARTRYV